MAKPSKTAPRTFKRKVSPGEPPGQVEAGLGAPSHPPPEAHVGKGPYIPASKNIAEVTIKAVLLGMLLSVVLGAANAYLGLKAGLTVAAAIPAAVVSLAVLRLFKKHTILENNMVQTVASAGSAVVSGMLFTIPALMILKDSAGNPIWDSIHYWETTIIGVVGGMLGVLFTVPLRRALIVEENLAFPEGVATAEVLKSGESGGSGVGALLAGAGFGLSYKFLQSGLHLWPDATRPIVKVGKAIFGYGLQMSAALLGVGYIIGMRVSTIIFGGSVFAWLVAMPILTQFFPTDHLLASMPAGCRDAITGGVLDTAGQCMYKFQVRYLGVGAMLVGGLYSLYKLRGPLVRAVSKGLGGSRGAADAPAPIRTEVELSPRTTFSGIAILLVPMFFFYAWITEWNFLVAGVMALIMVVTGFLFSAVGAYMAGIVGSSNNPISGVTILTLMVSAFSLKLLGIGPDIGAAATIFVAAVIAIAGSIASDNLQDLKAGYMLGATPRRQQAMIAIGAVVSAFFLAPILNVLLTGPAGAVTLGNAPQSNLMASIASGIFGTGQDLPYDIVGYGALLAFVLILVDQTVGRKRPSFRIPIMAVAVGMYLPIETTAPICAGGIIAYYTARLFRRKTGTDMAEGTNKGVLFASGLIAGEALIGIVTSGLAGIPSGRPGLPWLDYLSGNGVPCAAGSPTDPCNAGMYLWLSDGDLAWPGLVLLAYIGLVMAYVALRKLPRKTSA